ncbi:MAG: SH3 domain-containing protein [Clostridia bacterium]|nr:SH3 domain-containing protein [Clostridia bacterium]
MKHMCKRMVALALALLMTLSVMPERLNGSAKAAGAYGKVTADEVFLRKKPNTSADYWFRLSTGYVCEVLDVKTSGQITWYNVNVEHPSPESDRTYIGYIHGDFFTLLTEEEAAEYEKNGALKEETNAGESETVPGGNTTPEGEGETPPSADQDSSSAAGNTTAYAGATGQITNDGVNFRVSEGGQLIRKLDRGTVVEILSIPAAIDTNHWYKIRYDGDEGYVMSTFMKVVSTGDPNGTPTDPDGESSLHGYVRLVLSSANLRLTPGGTVGAQWENTGEVLRVVDQPVEYRGFIYYPVIFEGNRYYVREDTVQLQATSGSSGSTGSSENQQPENVVGYVRTTKSGVNLRLNPAGKVIEQIKKNTVLPVLVKPFKESGYYWYRVQTEDGARGYLRADCVKECNADGSDIGSGPVVTDTPVETDPPKPASYGYVITVLDKVNLRTKPAGSSQEQIALGVVLPLTGEVITNEGKYEWYPVKAASGKTGVLRGDCVKLCNADGSDIGEELPPENTETSQPTESTKPEETDKPTETTPPVSEYGYVMLTKPGVNLRKTAGGDTLTQLDKDTVWPMTGDKVKQNGVYWYPIKAEGRNGFVREDCCFKLSATQQESYLAGNGVPEEKPEEKVSYVITILDSVNLRAAATKDSTAKFNVPLGTVMAYKQGPVANSNWYKVIYKNTEVWVLGTCVEEMTAAEFEAWLEKNPDNTPQTDVVEGYVKILKDEVNLRKTASGKVLAQLNEKDTVYAYSKTEAKSGYTWYYVKSSQGYGYLRSDCVMECNADGSNFVPENTNTPGETGQEASYTTLKKGSTGTAVKNLVEELKNQGYYTGEVTSSYTTEVENAVKKFQAANGLTVDGIAGSKTQHKLFGTVPIGSGDPTNLTMTIYPAEKIDWFTGGIQQLWPKGANQKVYDVRTGIVWWAHRWSGAYHADIEPLTAADTARLCKIYGVKNAEEIVKKDLWEKRPCLVTIGTRTFACSLYGVPHNPDGDTIPDNDMTGQICLHFTNSKGHESGKVSSGHTKATEEAYQNAPNGQKK